MTELDPEFDHDKVDRTVLASLFDGSASSLDDALEKKEQFEITVTADDLSTRTSQAAFFAAIAAGQRAAGRASASVPRAQQELQVLAGQHRGRTIIESLGLEGVTIAAASAGNRVELLMGTTATPKTNAHVVLKCSWHAWTARVAPFDENLPAARGDGNVLAAIAAGALGVHEAFGIFKDTPGRDDGYRTVELNLWDPTDSAAVGPELTWAPSSWWLIGLGHLGQANAWVLSWLGLPDDTEIVLQDDGVLSEANHSTGMLTPLKPIAQRKTRQAAIVLEAAGLRTRIIEDRYRGHEVPDWAAETVALFGVDDVRARRLISQGRWKVAIDVGLGTGHENFDGILLHRFPGATVSDQIPAWQDTQTAGLEVPVAPAFQDLLERYGVCGVAELAGTAVGAAFVGVVAATIAIAEAVRPLHEGTALDVVRADLGPWTIRTSAVTSGSEPAATALLP